jgi:hypothetical protein
MAGSKAFDQKGIKFEGFADYVEPNFGWHFPLPSIEESLVQTPTNSPVAQRFANELKAIQFFVLPTDKATS